MNCTHSTRSPTLSKEATALLAAARLVMPVGRPRPNAYAFFARDARRLGLPPRKLAVLLRRLRAQLGVAL